MTLGYNKKIVVQLYTSEVMRRELQKKKWITCIICGNNAIEQDIYQYKDCEVCSLECLNILKMNSEKTNEFHCLKCGHKIKTTLERYGEKCPMCSYPIMQKGENESAKMRFGKRMKMPNKGTEPKEGCPYGGIRYGAFDKFKP